MPKYEYRCKECNKTHEISGTYETLFSYVPVCPHCGAKKLDKIIGKVPFILNGTGWAGKK